MKQQQTLHEMVSYRLDKDGIKQQSNQRPHEGAVEIHSSVNGVHSINAMCMERQPEQSPKKGKGPLVKWDQDWSISAYTKNAMQAAT